MSDIKTPPSLLKYLNRSHGHLSFPIMTRTCPLSRSNNEYAVEEAGKAAGRLLYQLLYDDKREFETR